MADKPIVVKIGGSTLGSHDTTLEDLFTLQRKGDFPVVVHGGGKVISQWMERQGVKPRFVRGLRVTDAQSLEVVTAVLTGLINKQLVAALLGHGARVLGLSGVDGAALQARLTDPELGYVGEVTRVDPEPVWRALEAGYIPLIAPVGLHCFDGSGRDGSFLNINGDTAAGEIARALGARRLVFLTDVPGVLDDAGRVLERLTGRQVRLLLESGVASGGMIPKLEAALRALETVPECDIVDGRTPHALLASVLGQPQGTRIRR